ncbi:hypothetical protein CHS0354_036650 [Potamilus streckersoni]|uniref:Uncharacterized protein n=1 Tax=Potamilus streckersoni TaxID=2493646 RepID=A0AAE0SS87_9BIVA|nr:hypothetical protein CHS0354_036650 [Potamilus streckersoni]
MSDLHILQVFPVNNLQVFPDAKLCLKNYDIGEREGNVYYCQDLVLTECCEIEREFTCCEPGKSKHLREQLQLWGAVLLFVLILMVLCIYYRRDSPACSSPTLSEACCSCMEKLSCTKNRTFKPSSRSFNNLAYDDTDEVILTSGRSYRQIHKI